MRKQDLRQPTHPVELRQWYERALAGTSARSRQVELQGGGRVHLVEKGVGTPLVLIHGSGVAAGFFLPLLEQLEGVHAMAVDLPGRGMSDPVDQPRDRYRETAVAWLDRVLDALGLEATAVLGHSGGGLWSLWYALAHPDRVRRLVLIGPPALPGARCPLPYRLVATPGLGELARRVPPTPRSTLRFAAVMGEGETLPSHPELVDLLLKVGSDPMASARTRDEVRVLVSPLALMQPSGFRRRVRVRPDELRRLAVPTLLVWGEREPLGSPTVARAVSDLIPDARLEVLPGGHAPWLGEPGLTALKVAHFVR